MDINDLMYFEKSEVSNSYCLAMTESGQVFYCVADENKKPSGEWKLVSIDEKAMSILH